MPPKRPAASGGVVEPLGPPGGDVEPKLKHRLSQGAKLDPKGSRSRSKSRPPEVPEVVLGVISARQTITVNGIQLWKEKADPQPLFDYLTSADISEMPQSDAYNTRLAAYETVYPLSSKGLNYRVWFNFDYLISGMQAFMMPPSQRPPTTVPDQQKVFVVNFGGAGTGKSNGLYAAGLNCMNTFILDPDRFYEFFATFLGYWPINDPTKQKERDFQAEWDALKASFDHYEHVIAPSEILKGRTRPIEQNCSVKAVCMTNYREMLTAVMYEVFKMALGIPLNAFEIIDGESGPATPDKFIQEVIRVRRLSEVSQLQNLPGFNIVFDSTGSMFDVIKKYIELAVFLGYKIVFVGVYSTLKNCLDRVLPPKAPVGSAAAAAVESEAAAAVESEAAAAVEANVWVPLPDKLIERSDIKSSTTGDSVKCRNTEQHRKTEKGGLIGTWYGMVGDKVNELINYPLENAYRLILVENNKVRESGAAGIIYDSGDSSTHRFIENDEKTPRCALYRSDGFYEVTIDILIQMEKAAAAKAAAKKAAAGAGAAVGAGAAAGFGGASRKRRLHTNRPRRTMKKYVRRVTRRRGGRGGHRSRRYRR
jgi:hypothetical protein